MDNLNLNDEQPRKKIIHRPLPKTRKLTNTFHNASFKGAASGGPTAFSQNSCPNDVTLSGMGC